MTHELKYLVIIYSARVNVTL